jgi:hypothetical protein
MTQFSHPRQAQAHDHANRCTDDGWHTQDVRRTYAEKRTAAGRLAHAIDQAGNMRRRGLKGLARNWIDVARSLREAV